MGGGWRDGRGLAGWEGGGRVVGRGGGEGGGPTSIETPWSSCGHLG